MIRTIKAHMFPLVRQVQESIEIASAKAEILNSKQEYNRCLLPSLRVEGFKQKPKKNTQEEDL